MIDRKWWKIIEKVRSTKRHQVKDVIDLIKACQKHMIEQRTYMSTLITIIDEKTVWKI